MTINLEELAQRVKQQEKAYQNQKERKQRLYQYARSKGFSSTEARVMSGFTQEAIDHLAQERAQDAKRRI